MYYDQMNAMDLMKTATKYKIDIFYEPTNNLGPQIHYSTLKQGIEINTYLIIGWNKSKP